MSNITSAPLKLLTRKNYLAFIEQLPGSTMWQHLYGVNEAGEEVDATRGGIDSCAYMLSSVLYIFKAIGDVHATVSSTIRDMEASGWRRSESPEPGTVVVWDGHVGFYLADDRVISNLEDWRSVQQHGLRMPDGREPIAYYTYTPFH